MRTQPVSSRAECAYCGVSARPNAMYCMSCGQIISATPRHAGTHSAGAHIFSPQPEVQPTPQAAHRTPMQQHLPQMSSVPIVPMPEQPRVEAPAVPPPLPRLTSAAHANSQIVELALASGERAQIQGTTVLGRMPEATARNAGAAAIAIPDDTKSISRAHAILEQQGQAVTISDAGSANGSSVERDGSILVLSEGRQISLRDGDRIWLGDIPLEVHITSAVRRTTTTAHRLHTTRSERVSSS